VDGVRNRRIGCDIFSNSSFGDEPTKATNEHINTDVRRDVSSFYGSFKTEQHRVGTQMTLLPFKHPFTAIVSGPTGCGKTSFVLNVIDNADTLIQPTPDKIIYYFAEYQLMFDKYSHVDFRQGVPKSSEIEDIRDALVILDDMMIEADQKILNIFTYKSHHREISVIFLVQNFFNKNK